MEFNMGFIKHCFLEHHPVFRWKPSCIMYIGDFPLPRWLPEGNIYLVFGGDFIGQKGLKYGFTSPMVWSMSSWLFPVVSWSSLNNIIWPRSDTWTSENPHRRVRSSHCSFRNSILELVHRSKNHFAWAQNISTHFYTIYPTKIINDYQLGFPQICMVFALKSLAVWGSPVVFVDFQNPHEYTLVIYSY